MGLMDYLKTQFLEIIQWEDDTRDTLSWRFPDQDKEIKRGAQLIVRESQVAQFLYLGAFGDTFGPGKHTLNTDNIPILSTLKGWKYGFESPFKADVYFVNTRLFTGCKWGTGNPFMLRDPDFGIVRVRAYGTYDFKVSNPQTFLREVAGTDHHFRLDEFQDTMRSRLVSAFTDALASSQVPVLDVATRYTELGEALMPVLNPILSTRYGLELGSFVVENVSVPAEVEQAIDKRSSMAAIGNLNDYVKLRFAESLGSGQGSGGAAGNAAEIAMGFGLAQQLMNQPGGLLGGAQGTPPAAAGTGGAPAPAPGLPELLSPTQVAELLGVSEEDVLSTLADGSLKGRRIGSTWRVTRQALDEFLRG